MLLGGSVEEGAVMVSHVLHTCCDVPSKSLFVTLETQRFCVPASLSFMGGCLYHTPF